MQKLSIIILNWNGQTMLRRYLPSVLRHSAGAEIVVADNASTDGSLALLRTEFPTVRVIPLTANWGFAEGYNKALQQVEAEYVVLLNSDVEVTEGWTLPLLSFMEENPDVAAVQPKILKHHGEQGLPQTQQFEYAGAAGGFIDRWGYPYCRGRIFATTEEDRGQYDLPMEVHWATGACLMIRRADYLAAGGLDARFFAHNEEIDLCWRLRILGKRIFCLPASRVYHLGGGTLPQGNPRKTYLNFRNNLTMLYKNLPQQQLRKVMFVRLVLDHVALLQSLLKGNRQDAQAIRRARKDFNQWKSNFLADRQLIQSRRLLPPQKDLSPLSLLPRYYLLRQRTWSEIASRS